MDWTWTCKTKTWKTMTCITWTRKTRASKARTEKTRTFKTRTSKTRTCKARTWHAYYNSIIKMGVLIWSSFFSYMLLKLKSRMSLTGNTVTMATYDVMKMTILFNNDWAFVWYHRYHLELSIESSNQIKGNKEISKWMGSECNYH